MKQLAEIIGPMFGPMAIWIFISAIFGPFQIWMGASKCRRRVTPPPSWSECALASVSDGSLFIFAIGTAGGVFAVALAELCRHMGKPHPFGPLCLVLILVSVLIISLAAGAWTDARNDHASRAGGASESPTLLDIVHGPIDRRDIIGSIRHGAASFACALTIEGIRLAEVLHLAG